MDAPTEWTYGGRIDWSSADSLKLLPVQLPLRCIVEALNERYAAHGSTAAAAMRTFGEVTPLAPLMETYNPLAKISDYAKAVQWCVTRILEGIWERFVNHTAATGGDFTGYEHDDFPLWNETEMLAAIGAEKRIALTPLCSGLSEWLFQQYQILNMLRWHRKVHSSHRAFSRSGNGEGGTCAAAWSGAEGSLSAWASADSTGNFANGESYLTDSGPTTKNASISLYKCDITLTNNVSLIPALADFYAYSSKKAGADVFYAAIPGALENKMSAVRRDISLPVGGSAVISDISPAYERPLDPPAYGIAAKTCVCHEATVMKFDVPGGFKFVE